MAGKQTAAAPEVRATKVSAQRGRRRFTAEYKASIVQQAAQCRAPGERLCPLIVAYCRRAHEERSDRACGPHAVTSVEDYGITPGVALPAIQSAAELRERW